MMNSDDLTKKIEETLVDVTKAYPKLTDIEALTYSYQLVQLGLLVNISNSIEVVNNNILGLSEMFMITNVPKNKFKSKYKEILNG
jgi:hypothetical protein